MPKSYCIPLTEICRPMQDWGVYWQAIGILATMVFGVVGLIKIWQELRSINEKKIKEIEDSEKSALLRRTEFFLMQHRRLFDDPILFGVLCHIDGDGKELAKQEWTDKKRKFLVFVEEIALLVRSNQIDKEVACYMFGHYALCAKYGANFAEGLDPSREHWELFFEFCDEVEKYQTQNDGKAPQKMSL